MSEDELKKIDQLSLSNAFNAAVEVLEHFGILAQKLYMKT